MDYIAGLKLLNEYDKRQEELENKRKEYPRLVANEAILELLTHYVRTYPDIRFGQALYNLGIATHTIELTREDIPKAQELSENLYNKGTKPSREEDLEQHTPRYRDIFFEESTETLKKVSDVDWS